jgi:hypothetical protein
MAGASLFTLIDDIATLLDDVSTMTKVAVEKTAGVLGDDLALNAYQVSGVTANRELPVVWAVAKGSMVNKAILVPLALVISSFAPQAVMPMLMIGGIYLCYEGVEKLVHRWLHSKEEDTEKAERLEAVQNATTDMVLFERERIKGAIRTDFVLSAEIIVISLATVAKQQFINQVGVLTAVSLIMTCGVYGLVGGIVKLDDLGFALIRGKGGSLTSRFSRWFGHCLIRFSPFLLKFLSIAGTVAMFLVGGSIIAHGVTWLHHGIEHVGEMALNAPFAGGVLRFLTTKSLELVVGVAAGAVALVVVNGCGKLFKKK